MFLKAKRMSGLVAAGLVFLVGCGEEEQPSPEEEHCSDGWCDFREVEGAYAYGNHNHLFCYIEEARSVAERDSIDLEQLAEDLPDWGEAASETGDAVILDVSTTEPNDVDERIQEIGWAMAEQGSHVDTNNTIDCMDEVDQAMIEESEGPYEGPVPARREHG